MDAMKRREFLNRSARTVVALGAAGVAAHLSGPRKADAANDRIVMGIIGLGGRASSPNAMMSG